MTILVADRSGQAVPFAGVSPDPPTIAPPGRLAITRAVPAGSRRARYQHVFLRALLTDPRLDGLRADARRAVVGLARVYARHACWATMTTWRPRERLCADVGSSRDPERPLSISAYKAARRWLEAHGYLGLVSPGTHPDFRPIPLDGTSAAMCPVYVLTMPRRRRPMARCPSEVAPLNRPLASVRRTVALYPRTREAGRGRSFPGHSANPPARTGHCPEKRASELAVAAAIRDRCRPLRRLSLPYIRHLIRPFAAAGWPARDITGALEHHPGGRQHWHTQDIRHPAGWARSRLTLWLDPRTGEPVPSPTSRREAERQADRERMAALRPTAPPSAATAARGAARARELLRAASPAARQALLQHQGGAPGRQGRVEARAQAEEAVRAEREAETARLAAEARQRHAELEASLAPLRRRLEAETAAWKRKRAEDGERMPA